MSARPARSLRHPPGRAGRLWLQQRLAAAIRGGELLERKLAVLRREEARLAAQAERTRRTWDSACTEAERRGLVAAALAGDGVAPSAAGRADVDVTWTSFMGVRYPTGATCRLPEGPPPRLDPSAAVLPARAAYGRALEAGVAHAAALAAHERVAAEGASTRTRLRAVEDHWRPRLEQALSELQASLAEEESADGVRLRLWPGEAREPE